MKNIIITTIATLVFAAGNALAGTNINSFAYQLQQASNVVVNARADGNANNSDMVIGSQVIQSDSAVNVHGQAQQEIHAANIRVTTSGATDSTIGLQVVASDDVINVNGSVDQLLFASNVAVVANDVENSVVGAQVIQAKGDLNINGAAQQLMFADNIHVRSTNASGSIVGAQVIAGR